MEPAGSPVGVGYVVCVQHFVCVERIRITYPIWYADSNKIHQDDVRGLKEVNKAETEAKLVSMERALKRKNKRIKRLYAVSATLVVLLVAGSVYGGIKYTKLQDENTRLSNPQESAKAEMDRVKEAVEMLVDTPKDETPIIATVTDVEKLKSQPFYANAQNGDKALFYEKSKRAILYRPSTNKIINTSTIDINTSSNGAATGSDAAATPGTGTPKTSTEATGDQPATDTTTNP